MRISSIFLFCFELAVIVGSEIERKCRRKRSTNCNNIYIWRTPQLDFTSLANVTYHKPHAGDDGALRGRKIRVLVSEMYPYVMYRSKRLDGFIGDFWTALQNMLHFENEIIVENDYDKALEMMVDGAADAFLSAVVPNEKLNKATVYSQPYLLNWYLIGYREPDEGGSSDFFVRAFEKELLITTAGIYVLLCVSLWGGLQLLAKFKPQSNILSLPSCLIAVVGGFLNQASELNITFMSFRIIIMTSLLFGYIIYTSLNAVLVSQLTNLSVSPPISSLDDAAVHRTHSVCVRNSSFVYNYFLDESKSILPKWKNIVNGPNCKDIRDINNLAAIICNPNVIILENRPIFASVFNLYPVNCNIKFLPGRVFQRYNFIVYHKSFDFQNLMTKGMKQIKSSGILSHLEDKWFDIKSSFNADKSSGAMPAVNLNHVGAVLIMLVVMMCLSLGILGCEIAHRKMHLGRYIGRGGS